MDRLEITCEIEREFPFVNKPQGIAISFHVQWVEENGVDTDVLYTEDGYYDTSCTWKMNQSEKNIEDIFGKIMPRSEASDTDVAYWGNERKHDIQASFEDGVVVSIVFRFDMREPVDELIDQLVRAADELHCVLFIPGQRVLANPDVLELRRYLSNSDAAKYVLDRS